MKLQSTTLPIIGFIMWTTTFSYLGVHTKVQENSLQDVIEPTEVVAEEDIEPPITQLPEVLETQEDIVKYIHQVFGDAGDEAERVARCESSLRPDAQNDHSTAAGIFQIIKGTWYGYNGDIPYDERYLARKNIEVAYELYKARGWQPWQCQP